MLKYVIEDLQSDYEAWLARLIKKMKFDRVKLLSMNFLRTRIRIKVSFTANRIFLFICGLSELWAHSIKRLFSSA